MFLAPYNDNVYLSLASNLENGLSKIKSFIDSSVHSASYNRLQELTQVYNTIFSDPELNVHLDFAITKTHKVLYFKEVDYNRTNSYYHLKLILKSVEIVWLDQLYGGILSRIIKYYKALFSKIDNIYANTNSRQESLFERIVGEINNELKKLHEIVQNKEDINSEKKRLKEQYLTKIPFRSLFHITHIHNIPGILSKGILSHTKSHSSKILQVDISNPEINQKRKRTESINYYSIHDYAPLYLNPRNPMLQSLCLKRNLRTELVIIKVSPNILVNKNVLFTDGNAAEESSKFYNNLEDFNKLNWECINDEYFFGYTDGKRIKCSEVLVHDYITIPYINEMVAFNENVFESILNLYPNHIDVKLSADKSIFY